MSITDQLLEAVLLYGLLVLFGVIMIASVGVPFPISLTLVAAGSFVKQGEMKLAPVIIAASIAAALPVFRRQGFGHFVNVISTAGIQIKPTMAVYAGTKNAVRTITEALRQEAGDKLRVTSVWPGFVNTNLADSMTNPEVKSQIIDQRDKMAIPPSAIARAIAFAIEQPADIDVNEIVIRPTAQV